MPRRSEIDELIKRYLRDRDSEKPPAHVQAAKERILDRMPRDRQQSGSWDLEDWVDGERRIAARAWAAEHEARVTAERRLWAIIILVISSLLGGGAISDHFRSHHTEIGEPK